MTSVKDEDVKKAIVQVLENNSYPFTPGRLQERLESLLGQSVKWGRVRECAEELVTENKIDRNMCEREDYNLRSYIA